MDFDEFARQFRERTAARLLEFEGRLARAQAELEKSAEQVQRSAQAAPSAIPARPRPPAAGGQVKSVLRKG